MGLPRPSSEIQETRSDGNPGSKPTFAVSGGIISETARMAPEPIRCWPTTDPAYIAYHDEEWGRPVRDERGLYERLCLEGFQSGLAWITILRKREAFRAAFAGFDPERVARFGDRERARRARAPRGRDAAAGARVVVPAGGAAGAAELGRLALDDAGVGRAL